jgi:putative glutamine amidotransferase
MNRNAKQMIRLVLMLAFVLGLNLSGQVTENAPTDRHGIRLVVFNPEASNILALETLLRARILDLQDLTVTGIYHLRQTGDFEAAQKTVLENRLDWFRFRSVSCEIGPGAMYRTNACTPEFESIIKEADGVVFFGGPDLPPSLYGEKTLLLTGIEDPFRHFFELSAIFHLLGGSQYDGFQPLLESRPGFPVLGICLGMQSLNVATGGTMVQDIWAKRYGADTVEDAIALGPEQWHNNPWKRLAPQESLAGYHFHSLALAERGLFVTAMGFKPPDLPNVLSSHHQAVRKPGKDLVPIAFSRDGKIIEAVAHRKYAGVLGVQFHPEHPALWTPGSSVRQEPGGPSMDVQVILAAAPPSLEFHKTIWAWFASRLRESSALR